MLSSLKAPLALWWASKLVLLVPMTWRNLLIISLVYFLVWAEGSVCLIVFICLQFVQYFDLALFYCWLSHLMQCTPTLLQFFPYGDVFNGFFKSSSCLLGVLFSLPAFPATAFDWVTVFLAAPSCQVKLRVAGSQNFFLEAVGFKFITSGSLHLKTNPPVFLGVTWAILREWLSAPEVTNCCWWSSSFSSYI